MNDHGRVKHHQRHSIASRGIERASNPLEHLKGYTGWMHADGYSGFNELYQCGRVGEVSCMAHVRRKFVDVRNPRA